MGLAILKAAFASDTDPPDTLRADARDRAGTLSQKLADNYLCNLSVAEFHEACEHLLPEEMHGEAFLEKYGETVDTAHASRTRKVVCREGQSRTRHL